MGQAMETTVDGSVFRIEFSYTRKNKLARGININGIAVCVIVEVDSRQVMLGTAVCSPSDQFSKRMGRIWAFSHATESRAFDEKTRVALRLWFHDRFLASQVIQQLKPKFGLTPEQIAAMRHTVAADLIRENRKRMRQIRERSGAGGA